MNEIMESNQVFYYTSCNTTKHIKLAGPTTASSHPSNKAALKEMSQRYKVAGNVVFDLTRGHMTEISSFALITSFFSKGANERNTH